jgi:hypothetical protein
MAGGASTGFFAGMLNINTIGFGRVKNGLTRISLNHLARWAKFGVGQYNNLGHGYNSSTAFFKFTGWRQSTTDLQTCQPKRA